MERETHIDLSERLISLVRSQAQGVQGLDPLIEDVIKKIMEKDGIEPETRERFTGTKNGGGKECG